MMKREVDEKAKSQRPIRAHLKSMPNKRCTARTQTSCILSSGGYSHNHFFHGVIHWNAVSAVCSLTNSPFLPA